MAIVDDLVALYSFDTSGAPTLGSATFIAANGVNHVGNVADFPNQSSAYYLNSPYLTLKNAATDNYTHSFWFKDLKNRAAAPYGFLMALGYNKETGGAGGYAYWDYETNYDVVIYTNDMLGAYGHANTSASLSTLNSTGYQMTQALYNGTGWHHMMCVFDGTQMTYYINGAQVGVPVNTTGAFKLQNVGSWTDYSYGAFDEMDELAIWQRAVTASEVLQIYNAGRGNLSTLLRVASVPDITGSPAVTATFDGSGSTGAAYYHWSWLSGLPLPFPDNGAATPIDMTGNLALYHFETTGATTPDTSGGSRNLTVNGATQSAGKVGNYAFDFDGTNDYLEYTAADVLPGTTNAISIAFWQYGDGGNNSIMWAEDGSGTRVINIHLPWGTTVYFDCGSGYGSASRLSKSAAASEYSGQWNHWVFTKDVSSGTMEMYLNGTLWESGTGKTDALPTITKLVIGAQSGTSAFYDGKIDELAVWSRVISASEVSGIYTAQTIGLPRVPSGSSIANASIPFPDSGATSPINMTDNEGLWHFEGNANDTSGNSRNGTVTGASLVTGKVGLQAYQFGAADNINFGAASNFITADFTISLWLKGDAAWTPAVYDSIVGASNAFVWNSGFGIFWHNATTIRCFVGSYGGNYADITVSAANWNHILMTWDGANIKAYLNGGLVSTKVHTSALNGLTENFYASWLGTHGGGEQTIDELAIWSRAVSATEVFSIYAAQNGALAGLGSNTLTFTPDIVGTYTIKLDVGNGSTDDADAVISAAASSSDDGPWQGLAVQGLIVTDIQGS